MTTTTVATINDLKTAFPSGERTPQAPSFLFDLMPLTRPPNFGGRFILWASLWLWP
jgi:hypothetical protein